MVRPLHVHNDLIWVTVARWLIRPRLRDHLPCRGNDAPQSDYAWPGPFHLFVVEAHVLVKAPPFLSTRGQVLVDLISQLIDQVPGGRIPQGFDVPDFNAAREHAKSKSGRPVSCPGDECHMGRAVIQRPDPGFDVPVRPKHNNLSCWVCHACRARLPASRVFADGQLLPPMRRHQRFVDQEALTAAARSDPDVLLFSRAAVEGC